MPLKSVDSVNLKSRNREHPLKLHEFAVLCFGHVTWLMCPPLALAFRSCWHIMLLSWTSRVHLSSTILQDRAVSARPTFRTAMAPKRKTATASAKAEAPAVKKTKAPKKAEAEKAAGPAVTSDGTKLSLIIEAW